MILHSQIFQTYISFENKDILYIGKKKKSGIALNLSISLKKWETDSIILSEINEVSRTEKNKYCLMSHVELKIKNKFMNTKNMLVVAWLPDMGSGGGQNGSVCAPNSLWPYRV